MQDIPSNLQLRDRSPSFCTDLNNPERRTMMGDNKSFEEFAAELSPLISKHNHAFSPFGKPDD